MTKFVKYVIICWLSFSAFNASAQDTATSSQDSALQAVKDSIQFVKDSIRYVNYKDKIYCDSLADSIFKAIVFDKFDTVAFFFPTLEAFQNDADSSEHELMKVKYETIYYRLVKDYKKFKKRAKKDYKFRIKSLQKKEIKTDIRTEEGGRRFCLVTIRCGYQRKKAEITFTMIKLGDRWYLGEKLRIREDTSEEK